MGVFLKFPVGEERMGFIVHILQNDPKYKATMYWAGSLHELLPH